MKVIENVFEEITEFSWLVDSYKEARKEKRYRKDVLAFSENLDSNLLEIQKKLRDGTFRFGPYKRKWVNKPKKRLIMALPFESRIVQWSIYRKLMPFYKNLMIEDSYACISGRGVHTAIKRVQYWLQQVQRKPGKWYCLKMDISKFFYRVDHQILLDILSKRIKDERLMHLLRVCICDERENFGLPRFKAPDEVPTEEWLSEVGMPIGNLTSQMFENIYLNELDQYCKHILHIHYYVRFADDIYILHNDKKQLNDWKTKMQSFLQSKLKLDTNNKTSISPIDKHNEFLGHVVKPYSLKLKKQSVRNIKSSFKGICHKYFEGKLTKEEYNRRVASYNGVMALSNNKKLKVRLNEIYEKEKTKQKRSA